MWVQVPPSAQKNVNIIFKRFLDYNTIENAYLKGGIMKKIILVLLFFTTVFAQASAIALFDESRQALSSGDLVTTDSDGIIISCPSLLEISFFILAF